jgi:hypothetical protein
LSRRRHGQHREPNRHHGCKQETNNAAAAALYREKEHQHYRRDWHHEGRYRRRHHAKPLNGLTKQGHGIFLTSTELPELFAMSNRLLVFCQSSIVGVISREGPNQERVMPMLTEAFSAAVQSRKMEWEG